mmetsp:Transcript_17955/g.26906  ORF Transcript_17955/g.26906 Transcript_17955/m.26906 type:complete len:207 (+) Transcript_17955:2-622(+)
MEGSTGKIDHKESVSEVVDAVFKVSDVDEKKQKNELSLFVKMLNGTNIKMNVPKDATLAVLKKSIEAKLNFEHKRQNLYIGNKLLEGEAKLLKSLGVTEDAVINLLIIKEVKRTLEVRYGNETISYSYNASEKISNFKAGVILDLGLNYKDARLIWGVRFMDCVHRMRNATLGEFVKMLTNEGKKAFHPSKDGNGEMIGRIIVYLP